MKLLVFFMGLLLATLVSAQVTPRPATQAQVDAGTDSRSYVTPSTLHNTSGGLPGSVVTNGTPGATLGYSYAMGNWTTNALTGAGGTNDVYVINSYEFPQYNLAHFHWSQAYGALTNYSGTNNGYIWLNPNVGLWEIGTNLTDAGTIPNSYYYNGGLSFPTNDVGNWTTNFGATMFAVDLVTTITSSNNSSWSLVKSAPQFVPPNPYGNFIAPFNGSTVLLGAPSSSGSVSPLVVAGNEGSVANGPQGRVYTAAYPTANVTTPMFNCGRYFGVMGNWTGDARAGILKFAGAVSGNAGGGLFILETYAAAGSPGNHGTFANPMMVATNGLIAMGNLTDAADANTNGLKPWAWLTVYGDGGAWAHNPKIGTSTNSQPSGTSSSVVPLLGLQSQPLIGAPVAGSVENNGTNAYYTSDDSRRWAFGLATTNGALVMPTNIVAFASPSGYVGFWPSNYDLYWVTPLKTNLVVLGH